MWGLCKLRRQCFQKKRQELHAAEGEEEEGRDVPLGFHQVGSLMALTGVALVGHEFGRQTGGIWERRGGAKSKTRHA